MTVAVAVMNIHTSITRSTNINIKSLNTTNTEERMVMTLLMTVEGTAKNTHQLIVTKLQDLKEMKMPSMETQHTRTLILAAVDMTTALLEMMVILM